MFDASKERGVGVMTAIEADVARRESGARTADGIEASIFCSLISVHKLSCMHDH